MMDNILASSQEDIYWIFVCTVKAYLSRYLQTPGKKAPQNRIMTLGKLTKQVSGDQNQNAAQEEGRRKEKGRKKDRRV